MKKKLIIIGVSVLAIVLVFFTYQYFTQDKNIPMQPPQETESNVFGNYLGSDYKGNYVWGAAMNLAWNELNDNIVHEKIQLDTDDALALNMVEKLNNAPFSKNDLDEESYYVKSGYGQETVDEINTESKKKFPSKSFDDLELELAPRDIISYAYFLKEVEYETMFKTDTVVFNEQEVEGFIADNKDQKENIKIIQYENDDKFIIKLQLKDKDDELILAKGYAMENPQKVVEAINEHKKNNISTMGQSDHFKAPSLHVDHHRNYIELIGKFLINKDFKDYFIAQMFENIKFDMDEKGARVENEAVIVMRESAMLEPENPKNLIMDKPYWVIMKRSDSQKPYFILGVNNIELMKSKK